MKFYSRFSLLCAVFASSVSLVSCSLSDELDKLSSIESIEGTGSINANILNETWSLKDLISTEELNIKEAENGNYSFSYENSDTYTLDKVKFPTVSADPKSLPLFPLNALTDYNNTPIGQYFTASPIIIDFEIGKPQIDDSPFADDFKIKAVKLKQGARMTIALDITSNSDTQLNISIPSLTKNGIPYSKTFATIYGSSQANLVIDDLDGYILSPEPKIVAVIQPKVKRISTPINGNIKTTFSLDISEYHEYVEGFFGEMKLPVDPLEYSFSMPEDFTGLENSHMTMKEIIVTLKATQNGFNVPVDLDLTNENFVYYKGNNEPKTLQIEPISADGQTFKFKVKNVNVLNIDKLVLNPVIIANKGVPDGMNKITDIASIDYEITTDLPLDLEAENLAFEQNGDNLFFEDPTDVNETDFEFTEGRIILKGAINSEIPMGASLQVFYKNETEGNNYLNTLFEEPVEIAAKGSSNFIITITKAKLDLLKKYKYQVMKITLNGSGAITSGQTINVKLGIAAKGTIKTKL